MSEPSPATGPSIAVLSRDLFFGMRIRNALKQLGYTCLLLKTEQALVEAIGQGDTAMALVDLNGDVAWDTIETGIAAHPDVPVVAFGAHTDVDAFRAAREAGATRVISNGAFSQQLPDLIARYARATGNTDS